MDILVRELDKSEYPLLCGFLYDAIFLPLGASAPPPSIVDKPELKLYIENFGHGCDHALAAEVNGDVVGAIWARVMDDYGHIDDDTPSLAMSVKKEYRNMGVGSRLLDRMLSDLREKGFERVSLSVQKENYAFRMYSKAGFEIFKKTDCEYIMIKTLR